MWKCQIIEFILKYNISFGISCFGHIKWQFYYKIMIIIKIKTFCFGQFIAQFIKIIAHLHYLRLIFFYKTNGVVNFDECWK